MAYHGRVHPILRRLLYAQKDKQSRDSPPPSAPCPPVRLGLGGFIGLPHAQPVGHGDRTRRTGSDGQRAIRRVYPQTFPHPSAHPHPGPCPAVITISAAGDCTLGGDPRSQSEKRFRSMVEKKGLAYFFENVKPIFEQDDLTVVNFEGTLTTSKKSAKGRILFSGQAGIRPDVDAGRH